MPYRGLVGLVGELAANKRAYGGDPNDAHRHTAARSEVRSQGAGPRDALTPLAWGKISHVWVT